MVEGRDPVRFAMSSTVRAAVLEQIANGATTNDLLEELTASTSAVYDALGELEERDLIRALDDTWELTGSGQLIVDILSRQDGLETVVEQTAGYFGTHDVTALPEEFRIRIGELSGASVLEPTETEPHRAVSAVSNRMEQASVVRVISPIYAEPYADAMPDVPGSKLLLDEQVVRSAIESSNGEGESQAYEQVEIRVSKVGFALGVTDSALMLSLPTLDGEYDSRTELVGETEPARQWGSELFDLHWADATPVEEFIERLV